MNPESFAEWQRRQGRQVMRTASSYWHEAGPRVYQAFPYHWLIQPRAGETEEMLRAHKAIGLRYSAPWSEPAGAASYHVILARPGIGLEQLSKKARYDVRKGLRHACVEPISFARLAGEGWPLRAETLARQGRRPTRVGAGAESREEWAVLCAAAADLPGFEAWGAIAAGRLVAALLAFTCDDCCSILYQHSSTGHLPLGVNNALAFVFSSQVLHRPGIASIFYGLQSLDAPPSVDRFKLRMGYEARPVRQRVCFHPRLVPLFNRTSYRLAAWLSRRLPGRMTLAKAEGLIRFHLEGQRPLARQDWPAPLAGPKLEPGD